MDSSPGNSVPKISSTSKRKDVHSTTNQTVDLENTSFISSSPSSPPSQQLVSYQGFQYKSFMLEKIKSTQEHFKARAGDVFLCSFPKTGTTWLKSLAFTIATRSQYYKNGDYSQSPLLNNFPHHCVPYIEHTYDRPFTEFLEGKHRLLATHIPFTSLPPSINASLQSGSAKIIYIWRDPKDTMVSYWHFLTQLFGGAPIPFEQVFNLFYEGKLMYSPYWKHILSYLEVSELYPENLLFIKYEDLKRNPELYVKRMGEFLGCPFSTREEEAGGVEKIVELCSFEKLSDLEVNKVGSFETMGGSSNTTNNVLFRKGVVGDWKNYLTQEMKDKLDLLFQEKLKGYGISFGDQQT